MVRKLVCAALLAVLVMPHFGGAQTNRRVLPLKIFYPNQGTYPTSVSTLDSASNTSDVIYIGIRGGGHGDLAPLAVTVTVTTADADISTTPDSIQIAWSAGISDQYSATIGVLDLIGITTHVRTFVFNTAGASSANNTQGSVWPFCDAIKMTISDASIATNDTFSYAITAFGVYEDDRVMDYLRVQYPNKRSDADSMLANTADVVHLGAASRGNLAPLGVSISVVTSDADISATPDSTQALYAVGIVGQFANILNATFINERTTLGTYIRSFVVNTTGESAAHNTNATVTPLFDALKISLKSPSATGDTVKYIMKALGVYKKGRIMDRIAIRYPNKSFDADSTLANTADAVYLGNVKRGDLEPVAVGISVTTSDADVSATPDSTQALYSAGVGGLGATRQYANMVSSSYTNELVALGTFIRTFVLNTTGAAAAHNTQGTVAPHFDALRIQLKSPSATGDTVKYVMRAVGVYQQQAH